MKLHLTCLLFSALVLPTLALDWPTRQRSVKTLPLQKTAETSFAFTNTGTTSVTILNIDPSCDCTEASASAQAFDPGASGSINVRIHLGDRTGVYERTITIKTDEAGEAITLRLQLDVPEFATLTPRSVEWKLNGPAWEKTVEILIADGLELTVTNVLPTSGLFHHRLETVKTGRHYRLYLSPLSTTEVSNAAFRIYAKAKDGQDVVVSAYGNVR
jgi:hypothetical protein